MRRTCQKCGLYHASLSALKGHTRVCGITQIIPHTRPVIIAAQRQREMMAVITYNDMEDVEWIDEEFLDVSGKIQCYRYLSLNMH